MSFVQFCKRTQWVAVFFGVIATADAQEVTSETITFRSEALDAPTTYVAVRPEPMEEGRKYPVLYLLHGAYGGFSDWTEKTTVTEMLKGRGMIVIMPDGGEFGWYLDSPLKPENQYESLVTRDLREDVERRFPVRTDRAGRGIAGLSMGGHGALSLAAKHPELYGSASSMSGILDIAAHPGKWTLDDLLGSQTQNMAPWKANSVYHLADVFTTAGVALLFDTGVSDKTGAVEDSRKLRAKLEELGVEHVYREYPGTHDWKYWGARIGEHLDFHQKIFAAPEDREH